MADVIRCRSGNWLLYIPENQYCTFVAKEMYVVVEMFNGRQNCFEDDLTFIKISPDVLSVCKFTMQRAVWTKQVAGKTLAVTLDGPRTYLTADNGESQLVGHLHTLQNAYQDLTGQLLAPNIYGIHHPD